MMFLARNFVALTAAGLVSAAPNSLHNSFGESGKLISENQEQAQGALRSSAQLEYRQLASSAPPLSVVFVTASQTFSGPVSFATIDTADTTGQREHRPGGVTPSIETTTVFVTPMPSSSTSNPDFPIVASPTPEPSTVVVTSNGSFSPTTIVVIVVPIVVGVILVIFGAYLWKRRRDQSAKGAISRKADVEKRPKPMQEAHATSKKRHTLPAIVTQMMVGSPQLQRADSRREIKSFYEPSIRRSRGASAVGSRPRTRERSTSRPPPSRGETATQVGQDSRPVTRETLNDEGLMSERKFEIPSLPDSRPVTRDGQVPARPQRALLAPSAADNSRPATREGRDSSPKPKKDTSALVAKADMKPWERDYYVPSLRPSKARAPEIVAGGSRPRTSEALKVAEPRPKTGSALEAGRRDIQRLIGEVQQELDSSSSKGSALEAGRKDTQRLIGEPKQDHSFEPSRAVPTRRGTNFSRPKTRDVHELQEEPSAAASAEPGAAKPAPSKKGGNGSNASAAGLMFF